MLICVFYFLDDSVPVLKGQDALGNREIFLSTVFLYNEETSSLFKLRVGTNFKEFKVFHLLFMSSVELNDILHEGFIVSSKFLSVLFQI